MTHTSELPRSMPEAQGIASSTIHSFVDALEQGHLGVHSFILVRNGHIVADGWWHPYASHLPHMLFSLSKSFTSTAIGLAINEGAATFRMQDDRGAHHVITCGRTDWRIGESPLWHNENRPVPITAHGGWRDEQMFVMTWQYIETPFRRIIAVEFHGDHVELSARSDLSFKEIESEQVQGHINFF